MQSFTLQFTNDSSVKSLSDYHLERKCLVKNDRTSICESFIKPYNINERCSQFEKINNSIFELKIIYDFDKTPLDTIKILNYSNVIKDSTFLYFYDVQKYPPTKPLGSDDYIYSLKEIDDNLYALYKENYLDSTFSEMQFYNKSFLLYKIIIVIKSKFYEYVNNDKSLVCGEIDQCFYKKYLGTLKSYKKFHHPYITKK